MKKNDKIQSVSDEAFQYVQLYHKKEQLKNLKLFKKNNLIKFNELEKIKINLIYENSFYKNKLYFDKINFNYFNLYKSLTTFVPESFETEIVYIDIFCRVNSNFYFILERLNAFLNFFNIYFDFNIFEFVTYIFIF